MPPLSTNMLKHLQDLRHIKLEGLRFRLVDAKGQIVGPLAAQISTVLQGKDKPIYTPKKNVGDMVIVINAAHVQFTHDQWSTKLYRWHTGHPGGLKEKTAAEMWDKNPTEILRRAVNGMIPKDRWRIYRMDKLKIFPEGDHPFTDFDLVPLVLPQKKLNLPGIGWPLPEGLEAMNPDKQAFRVTATPALRGAPRPALSFDDLLTEAERTALVGNK